MPDRTRTRKKKGTKQVKVRFTLAETPVESGEFSVANGLERYPLPKGVKMVPEHQRKPKTCVHQQKTRKKINKLRSRAKRANRTSPPFLSFPRRKLSHNCFFVLQGAFTFHLNSQRVLHSTTFWICRGGRCLPFPHTPLLFCIAHRVHSPFPLCSSNFHRFPASLRSRPFAAKQKLNIFSSS